MKKVVLCIGMMFVTMRVHAFIHETLPTWHWAYECIDELRLRGGFTELYSLTRPYTRGQIAEALVALRKGEMDRSLVLTPSDKKMFLNLIMEFKPEIEELQAKASQQETVKIGGRVLENVDGTRQKDATVNGIYRSRIGVPLGKFGAAVQALNFNQYLEHDPLYVGKRWRGFAVHTEQAYLRVKADRFDFKFGRDFLRWGPGLNGTLVFSDVSRPLDQFTASAELGPLRYTFLASVLDPVRLSRDWADSLGAFSANRYLSAHRLDLRLFKGRFQAGISELVLYGGVNRQLEWYYLNPMLFFHGESVNQNDQANTLGTLDLVFYPTGRWEWYGSLLIDDLQVEKTGPGDLEPAEIGWMAGTRVADPFAVQGLTLFGEYVRVTNRTYKTPTPWETFMHRNMPMGYPLGNDFDKIEAGFSKWINGNIRIKMYYDCIRKGEGSLYTPFDTPWDQYEVEKGYSEPFPTGTVEKQDLIGLSLRYFPSPHVGIEGEFASIRRTNAGHVEKHTTSESSWRIGLWLDGDWFARLSK